MVLIFIGNVDEDQITIIDDVPLLLSKKKLKHSG